MRVRRVNVTFQPFSFTICLERLNKINNQISMIPHNWTPMYHPPAPSLSPKLYNLVRNIRLNSVDRGSISMGKAREHLENVAEEDVHPHVRIFTILYQLDFLSFVLLDIRQ